MAKTNIMTGAIIAVLLLSFPGTVANPSHSSATPEEVKWSRVNLPTDGETGHWVLASGANVRHLTAATDGTLYAYANPSATSDTLFKSTDGGYSWSATGKVEDTIIDLATSPEDAGTVYYATAANVYMSTDAGLNFTTLPPNPGGAGSNHIEITGIDITRRGGKSIIAVGTRDTDSAQYGGAYVLDESKSSVNWINTGLGNYDVYTVAFSPNFAADSQLVALATNETDTLITTRIDDSAWGSIYGNTAIAGLSPISATIAFPDDYDATTNDYTFFAAVNTGSGGGDVYRIKGAWVPGSSIITDLDIGDKYNQDNVDVTGLAVNGDTGKASLLAGSANGTQIYLSPDSGANWTRSRKAPTGQSETNLLVAPDFVTSGLAYAATSGTESAFSYTSDGGVTWNQIGLIDNRISDHGIIDLAISPDYHQDNTLFTLTFDEEHIEYSLWRSLNSGATWERVFTSTQANADSLKLVELSPRYGSNSRVVFLTGTSGGNSTVWKSADNGGTFTQRGVPFPIDIWTVVSDDILFLGSYDGSNGLIYRTTNSGLAYSTGSVAGNQMLESMALSPAYEQDKTILVGTSKGWVYRSTDNGTSFRLLGNQLPLSNTGLSEVTVAFHPEYASNKTVYAATGVKATADSKERIFRFTIGRSETWESIDSNLPTDSTIDQLAISADGVLYAINSQPVDATADEGGMERTLNPTYSLGPTFETVIRNLDDGAILSGLWLRGSQLWSIDTANTKLMTYIDSLCRPVTLTLPADGSMGTGTANISLDWESLKGATRYRWQIDYDTDFSTVPGGFEGETDESSTRSPALATATTYHWRVRAIQPVLSAWSAKWSFTTSLGASVAAPALLSPEAAVSGLPQKPVFQWSALAGADSYELVVATDASFSNPVIVRIGDYALPSTAWQSDVNLDYNTTYYWKVRASGSHSYSAWSDVGAFTTELPPQSPPSQEPSQSLNSLTTSSSTRFTPPLSPPPPPPPPVISPVIAVTQSTIPDWAIYLGITLLLTIVLLITALLVWIVRTRSS